MFLKNLETTKRSFKGEWINWHIRTMEYYLSLKKRNEKALKRWKNMEGIFNAYYWVKEANLKKPYTIWFQLYDIPWNSPGQNTGVGSLSLLQGIFPTQGLNPGRPHCRQILYQLSHQGSPSILEWVACPFSSGSSWPRNPTEISWLQVYS